MSFVLNGFEKWIHVVFSFFSGAEWNVVKEGMRVVKISSLWKYL